MNRTMWMSTLVLLAVGCAVEPQGLEEADGEQLLRNDNAVVYPATASVRGQSLSEWNARWWEWLVSIPAGLLDMRFRNFMIASTIGTAIWTSFLTILGMKLQEEFSSIDQVLGPISTGVLALLVLVYVVRLARHKGDA